MPMKTGLLSTIYLLAFIGVLGAAESRLETPKPGVLFTGTTLPTPPNQGQPWSPPASKLPEKWASAVQEILKHGIADPRNCEYREVELTCGSSAWGGRRLVTTHAWVIPRGSSEKLDAPRFAVTWDGLIYPLTKIGSAADLTIDVEAMLAEDDKWWKGAVQEQDTKTKEDPKLAWAYRPRRLNHALPESSLVSYESLVPLKSCMMFILGEEELAQRLWNAWSRGAEMNEDRRSPADDPYLFFAREWGWALFDRAVGAHKRGDDVISMLEAKTLLGLEQAVEQVATARGFPRPSDPGPDDRKMPYLDFGEPPSRLLEDETRRVKAGKIERVLDLGVEKFPDQSKRIAALIRDLEVASAEQWEQPGGVSISESPIVQALIKEGQPAVEPLLECLANDRRLTRAVGFGRNFFPSRYFISVGEAAFATLQGILQVDHFGPLTQYRYTDEVNAGQRRAVADEIRTYWENSKGRTQQEMWFSVLADKNATDRQWLEAAQKIVAPDRTKPAAEVSQPANALTIDTSLVDFGDNIGLGRPLAGESLRGKKDPSVADLLEQRADDMARLAGIKNSFFDEATACDLTICLAKWDLKAAVPAIHRRIEDSRRFTNTSSGHGNQGLQTLARRLASLIEAGARAGNDASIQDYIARLRATLPGDFSLFDLSVYMPLWQHPDNPELAELARGLFLVKDGPLYSIHELTRNRAHEMICSPLVGVPVFRELLKRELANTSPLWTFVFKQDSLSISIVNANTRGSMSYTLQYTPDVELPDSDAKQTLRVCDFYAWEISRLEGSPRYELYWPEPQRDAVCKEVARFLDQWGNCFRDQTKSLESRYGPFYTARFRLPRLSQPATAEDVAASRAIFSLRDRPDAQVRIVPLEPYPHIARWNTLKQFPLRVPGVMEWPKDRTAADKKVWASLPKEPYDREGLIWQAEEVLLDGKWRRYYGFIGNHVIAKVPAEEIDLLDDFSPAHPHH
jgi:hypothetical protein